MLVFNRKLPSSTVNTTPLFKLPLTAEERTRSRYRFISPEGNPLLLRLPRGTILQNGDLLQAETGEIMQIIARKEPVLTVTAREHLDLLKAAYHLGNRHIMLEIQTDYLRLAPDPVLEQMLVKLGLEIQHEEVPFFPEVGAYHQHDRS